VLVKRILSSEELARERAIKALELNGFGFTTAIDPRYEYESKLQAASFSTYIKQKHQAKWRIN
jgi:hypothetical protein